MASWVPLIPVTSDLRAAPSNASIAPVAMLFIPCRGGVSHRPDEYASPQWIGSGVHVLARTLSLLAE